MEKEYLMTVLVSIAAIIAIVVVSVPPLDAEPDTGFLGYALMAGAKDKAGSTFPAQITLNNGQLAPNANVVATADTVVSIAASSSAQVQSFHFGVYHDESGCMQYLGSDDKAPFEMKWNPLVTAQTCGYGTYTVAVGGMVGKSKNEGATATAKLTISPATNPSKPFTISIEEPEDRSGVQSTIPVYVTTTGEVSNIEFYADSVYTLNGARRPELLFDEDSSDPYEVYWNTYSDPEGSPGDEYSYDPYGDRVLTVKAIGVDGTVITQRVHVTVFQLPPS
jgi:hypothetical protein